jgi:catechol 2,3-dioxygenase-like lactoylglutathione lyase family enzyme
MQIDRLDHLVLTVQDMDASIDFYTRVMGFEPVTFGGGRKALAFGRQKINLHPATAPLAPHARQPTPGSADLCFITGLPIVAVLARLGEAGVTVEAGPVPRTGATGPITSVYFRDPDGNLIEVSAYTE